MIQEITTHAELCAIQEEWSDLLNRCPGATPFNSPEWLLPWWTHMFQGGKMWTISVRDRGRLAGLALMFIHGRRHEQQQVSFIGAGVTDYTNFLVEDVGVARQIWTTIANRKADWDICDLQEIRPDAPMLAAPYSDLNVQRCISSVCPVLRLPRSMTELESHLSAKFRHNLRNSRNRLRDLGVTVESARPGQDEEYLQRLFQLHEARWRSKGQPGIFAAREVQTFVGCVCREFRRRDWLRFHGLRLTGVLRAVACNFCALGRTFYYAGGFDETLRKYSPGSMLVGAAIEQAIQEGCTEFDFLRDMEKYKFDWGATNRINTRLIVRRSESSAWHR